MCEEEANSSTVRDYPELECGMIIEETYSYPSDAQDLTYLYPVTRNCVQLLAISSVTYMEDIDHTEAVMHACSMCTTCK